MAKEIERKFLLSQLPESIAHQKPMCLEQGYLALDPEGKEVRLRKSDSNYWLTVKSSGTLVREEYEVVLDTEQFEALWPATKGRRLSKERYEVPVGPWKAEIDCYMEPLRGLMVVEVEFPDEAAAKSFEKAPWMGQEVTHLSFLKNKNLLQFESVESIMDLL